MSDLIAATGLVILLKFDPNHWFFSPCDFEIWCMTSKNNRAPLLCYIKLCVSFQIRRWIQTEVTLRKRSIRVKIGDFFVLCDLEIWWMTLENNRAPLLSNIKLNASFHHHMWIQTGVTVQKPLSWVVTSVTLIFDLWPCPFAWTLPWSLVITPENFMMIRWWEHSQKGVTDGQTDGRTDRRTENTIHRAAWSQIKMCKISIWYQI